MESFALPSKLVRRDQVREALRRAYGTGPKSVEGAADALLDQLRRLEGDIILDVPKPTDDP